MNMPKIRYMQWLSLVVVIMSFVVAIWAYPQLPEQVASHWNAAGEVNGHMSRFWGAFLMPVITLAMWPVMVLVPIIDPKAKNITKFKEEFDRFILAMFLFLFYIYYLTLAWNFGQRFDLGQMMVPAMGLLFIFIARMVRRAEPNYTIGIRTPWTLANETVWRKTHELAWKLFGVAGLITMASYFCPEYAMMVVLISVIGASVISIVYSYLVYRNEMSKK